MRYFIPGHSFTGFFTGHSLFCILCWAFFVGTVQLTGHQGIVGLAHESLYNIMRNGLLERVTGTAFNDTLDHWQTLQRSL
jgi:hypothetical protein